MVASVCVCVFVLLRGAGGAGGGGAGAVAASRCGFEITDSELSKLWLTLNLSNDGMSTYNGVIMEFAPSHTPFNLHVKKEAGEFTYIENDFSKCLCRDIVSWSPLS